MLKKILHRTISRFEQRFGYDGKYLHEVLDASLGAFVKFSLLQLMSGHQDQVPKEAWFAARIAATLSEDCGPCAQLAVNMALQAKLPARTIAALLRGNFADAGSDAALGFRYGTAVATNRLEALTLVEEVEQRYGKRGQVSLAFAVASARVYPALKRGLGHGAACARIVVSSEETITLK